VSVFKIKERINEILQTRQSKHPLEFPNAGSFLRICPGKAAGKLIEEMDERDDLGECANIA